MAEETLFSKPDIGGVCQKVIDIFHETAYNNKTDSSFVPSCL